VSGRADANQSRPILAPDVSALEARVWAAAQPARAWRVVSWRNGTHPVWRTRFCAIRATNGRIESGLFPVRSSGVSTAAGATAAEAFLAGLTPEQRKKTVYPVDDPEWRKWMNQSFYVRQT
jgi:hypothetical protein